MLHIVPPSLPSNVDTTAVSNLSNPPPNWSLEADEELVRFLVENCQSHDLSMNGANKYVDNIAVSTVSHTAQKMKFSITDFFSKCDQIRSFCRFGCIY